MRNDENAQAAEMFCTAIKKLAENEDNLNNLESYLSSSFGAWMKKFARTPMELASEMKFFAEMEM